MKYVHKTVLASNQYCIVENPIDEKTGKPRYGAEELRKGEQSFFLQPGEIISEGSIKQRIVLQDDEAILVKAREEYEGHKPGQKWMLKGPMDLIPPREIEIIERRKAIPLSKNEGVYVRDLKLGEVRLVRGPLTYLLEENEAFWQK